MVANMAAMSSHMKHSASPRNGVADPHKYIAACWPDSAPSAGSAKPDMVIGSSGMIIPPSPDDSSNSWEARAFAEDASSLAAGVWPPRAYPCSFCRREFRSAQALGGHMNVHRRDRARLRHASPPPPPSVPLGAPLSTSTQQPTSLFQAAQKCGVNQSARYYSNESLIKLNTPTPITLSKAGYTGPSFPLRLQQLASEAAASLMYSPQACEPSDLLALCPPSNTTSADFACHTNVRGRAHMKAERAMEISSSSSFSSPPSSIVSYGGPPTSTDATPCTRREAPIIRPEDQSPKKKSHAESNYTHSIIGRHIQKATNSLNHGLHAHDTQSPPRNKTSAQGTSYTERRREAGGGEVDLELRLGQRPP